jgi:putative phosphoribosyl transferase
MHDGKLIEDPSLRDRLRVFKDRSDAGARLALRLKDLVSGDETVLAIPAGGVPVASGIASALSLPLGLVIVRKMQIPSNPEAGFGAIDPDGRRLVNETLLARLGLSEADVRRQAERALSVISHREELFGAEAGGYEFEGRGAILVDDGLASGYTMLAAAGFVRRRGPRSITVAVPTAARHTAEFISGKVDRLLCLNLRGGFSFAVADAYQRWHDLTDEEVLEVLRRHRGERRGRQ